MDSKFNEEFARFSDQGFIKTSDFPMQNLDSEKKALLNRKGNEFFNTGDIESARRIYITTGYSDGLSRVGDVYVSKGRELDALKLYWLAHNKRKADPLIQKLARIIETVTEL